MALVLSAELILAGFVGVSPWLHHLIEHHGDGTAPHSHWHGGHTHEPSGRVVRKSASGRKVRGVSWHEAGTSHTHSHSHSHDDHGQGDSSGDHHHIGLVQLLCGGLLDIPGDSGVCIPVDPLLNLSGQLCLHYRASSLVTILQAPRPPPRLNG